MKGRNRRVVFGLAACLVFAVVLCAVAPVVALGLDYRSSVTQNVQILAKKAQRVTIRKLLQYYDH